MKTPLWCQHTAAVLFAKRQRVISPRKSRTLLLLNEPACVSDVFCLSPVAGFMFWCWRLAVTAHFLYLPGRDCPGSPDPNQTIWCSLFQKQRRSLVVHVGSDPDNKLASDAFDGLSNRPFTHNHASHVLAECVCVCYLFATQFEVNWAECQRSERTAETFHLLRLGWSNNTGFPETV